VGDWLPAVVAPGTCLHKMEGACPPFRIASQTGQDRRKSFADKGILSEEPLTRSGRDPAHAATRRDFRPDSLDRSRRMPLADQPARGYHTQPEANQ
jgi:hypothetical protein